MNNSLKDYLEKIKSLIKVNKDQSLNAEKYANLLSSIDKVVEYTEKYYVENEDGDLLKIPMEEQNAILSLYSGIVDAASDILKIKENGEPVETFKNIAEKIEDIVKSDITNIAQMKAPTTIKELMSKRKVEMVDIANLKTKNVGEVINEFSLYNGENESLNDNYTLSTEEFINVDDKIKNLNYTYRLGYQNISGFFNKIINNKHYQMIKPSDIVFKDGDFKLYEYFQDLKKKSEKIVDEAIKKGIKGPELDKIEEDEKKFRVNLASIIDASPADKYALVDGIITSAKIQAHKLLFTKYIEIGEKEDINDRASAMSYFAGFIGKDNLLSKTEKIKFVSNVNGTLKTANGTMRQKPNGIRLEDISFDDPIRRDENSFENEEFKKSIADLQIIDYICGNIDRDHNSIRYEIKNGKFTGVIGINNHTSFPKNDLIVSNRTNPGLRNLNVIDSETAKKIQLLTPEMLKLTLSSYNISKKAIDSACNRLENLQRILDKAIIYKDGDIIEKTAEKISSIDEIKITIIPTDKWDKITINELNNSTHSYFNSLVSPLKKLCKSNEKEFLESLDDQNLLNRKEAALSRAKVLTAVHSSNIPIQKLGKDMKNATSFFRGSSKLYQDIENNIKKIDILTNNFMRIPGKINSDDDVERNAWHGGGDDLQDIKVKYIYYSDKMKQDYLKLIEDTEKMADEYLDSKKNKKNNSYTKKRIEIVSKLQNALKKAQNNVKEKLAITDALDSKVNAISEYFVEKVTALKNNLNIETNRNLENQLYSDMERNRVGANPNEEITTNNRINVIENDTEITS